MTMCSALITKMAVGRHDIWCRSLVVSHEMLLHVHADVINQLARTSDTYFAFLLTLEEVLETLFQTGRRDVADKVIQFKELQSVCHHLLSW